MSKIMDYSISSNPSWSYKVCLDVVKEDSGTIGLRLLDAKTKEPIISLTKDIEPHAPSGYAYVNNDFLVDNLEFLEKNHLGEMTHKTKVYRNQTYRLVKLNKDNIIDSSFKPPKFFGGKGEIQEDPKSTPIAELLAEYKEQSDKKKVTQTKTTEIKPKRKNVDGLSM